jgi:hypothetical protein
MADPIEIVHPDKPHNQRDIDTAMLESAMLKSGATLAMMKSAAAEYEELGKIKSVAEYRAWVSAFKRREQMALATFAAVGSSSGLNHFEVDSSEASQIPELKGLMDVGSNASLRVRQPTLLLMPRMILKPSAM